MRTCVCIFDVSEERDKRQQHQKANKNNEKWNERCEDVEMSRFVVVN